MPLYDFRCNNCQNTFTVRASFKEKEDGLKPTCPECQSQTVDQVITAGLFLRSQGQNIGLPSCGPNVGPGCC